MPLKHNVVPLLDRASDTVVRTGAANTIVVADGQLIGENTDLYGMTQALSDAGVTTASGVTVLGAGATACTARAAAHELGCDRVTVIARNADRARQFLGPAAERIGFKVRITPWSEAPAHLGAEPVISALPPGAADELAPLWKPAASTLMDVLYLYRPWPTPPRTGGSNSRTSAWSGGSRPRECRGCRRDERSGYRSTHAVHPGCW